MLERGVISEKRIKFLSYYIRYNRKYSNSMKKITKAIFKHF